MHRNEKLRVSQLLLNTENPRLPSVGSQVDSIREMLRDQGEKLFHLASDIIENGLNPTESIAVVREGNSFIVHEGNRRIVALKLLETPEIIKDVDVKLFNKFNKLNELYVKNPVEEVSCTIFDTSEECQPWILVRHNGENQGKGIVSWNSMQKQRYEEHIKKKPSSMTKLIDFYRSINKDDPNIDEKIKNLKSTTLVRLIGDPFVRDALGITLTSDEIYCHYPLDIFVRYLNRIMKDASDSNFKVGEVYTKELRKGYIERLINEGLLVEKQKLDNPLKLDDISKSSNTNPINGLSKQHKKAKKSLPSTCDRDNLVPRSCNIVINNQRAQNLFNELKRARMSEYPNLVKTIA